MESKQKISLLKELYLGLLKQDEIYLSYFQGQKYRVIKKMVEFNGFSIFTTKFNLRLCHFIQKYFLIKIHILPFLYRVIYKEIHLTRVWL